MKESEYLAGVAAELAEQRRGLGLSMRTVAEAVGCSASAIGVWERGEASPSAYSLYKLQLYFRQQHAAVLPDGAAHSKKLQRASGLESAR